MRCSNSTNHAGEFAPLWSGMCGRHLAAANAVRSGLGYIFYVQALARSQMRCCADFFYTKLEQDGGARITPVGPQVLQTPSHAFVYAMCGLTDCVHFPAAFVSSNACFSV